MKPALIIGCLIALAVIFQLFFRYEYVPAGPALVMRVDRLTHQSCFVIAGHTGFKAASSSNPLVAGLTPISQPNPVRCP